MRELTLVGKVESYTIIYPGGGKTKLNFKATIELFDKGESTIGMLYFYLDPENMPPSDKIDDDQIVHSFFSDKEYERILDLLREDDSVYLHFIEEKMVAVLTTSEEHVGDHLLKSIKK